MLKHHLAAILGFSKPRVYLSFLRQNVGSQLEQEDTIKDDQDPILEWDELMRGHVLGAVSIGYLTTQIIGGRLTEYYGVKRVYGLGLFLTTILTFLSPVVAKLNVYAFMLLRIFIGVFEGVTFPALQAMTTRWIPVKERNSFIARSYFGSVFGLVITFPLCGFLSDTLGTWCLKIPKDVSILATFWEVVGVCCKKVACVCLQTTNHAYIRHA